VAILHVDLGPGVTAAVTTRAGGVSGGPYASLNLGPHVGDRPAAVRANREAVAARLGLPVVYVNQVHGADVATVTGAEREGLADADALVTAVPGVALAVMVADCLPILLADAVAGVVAAVHAGRRGLAVGVVPAALEAMLRLGAGPSDVRAYLGPAICGACYEVGEALRDEAAAAVPEAAGTTSWGTPSIDLAAGARAQLLAAGVGRVDVAGQCTREDDRFFSYRRDGATGRFAGVVALRPGDTPHPPS
jgi:YfiH family protein